MLIKENEKKYGKNSNKKKDNNENTFLLSVLRNGREISNRIDWYESQLKNASDGVINSKNFRNYLFTYSMQKNSVDQLFVAKLIFCGTSATTTDVVLFSIMAKVHRIEKQNIVNKRITRLTTRHSNHSIITS